MFNFSRRINRISYWAGYGMDVAILVALLLMLESAPQSVQGYLAIVYIVLIAIGGLHLIAVTRRRANDIGKYVLLFVAVAFVIPFGFVLVGIIPGQRTRNAYGIPPAPGVEL